MNFPIKKFLRVGTLAILMGASYSCETKDPTNSTMTLSKVEQVSNNRKVDSYPPKSSNTSSPERLDRINKVISECFDETMQSRFTVLYEKARIEDPDKPFVDIDPGEYKACKYPLSNTEIGYLQFQGSYSSHHVFINKKGETQLKITYPGGPNGLEEILIDIKKSDSGWEILDKH